MDDSNIVRVWGGGRGGGGCCNSTWTCGIEQKDCGNMGSVNEGILDQREKVLHIIRKSDTDYDGVLTYDI